jgi:hypothetical protein
MTKAASTFWRQAGLSYLQYLNVSTRAVRSALKVRFFRIVTPQTINLLQSSFAINMKIFLFINFLFLCRSLPGHVLWLVRLSNTIRLLKTARKVFLSLSSKLLRFNKLIRLFSSCHFLYAPKIGI